MANYGLAGQYNVHFDQTMMDKRSLQAREFFNVRNGDRMATIMGYLSDVQVGGDFGFFLEKKYVKRCSRSMKKYLYLKK